MKILIKFINELDSQKLFIRHFLDSMDKAKLVCEKFGSIRILNLCVNKDAPSTEADSELMREWQSILGPLVSFYSNLNKCHSVDLARLADQPGNFHEFTRVSTQIKKVINPLVIVFLGRGDTFSNARAFAEDVDFCFLDGDEFCAHGRLESNKYFADALHKFVFQTKSENIVLHLNVRELEDQWQILLFSLRPIIKTIFVNDSFKKLNQAFFTEFTFDGKLLEYSEFKLDFGNIFFEAYRNQFIVFDGDFPPQLSQLKVKRNFVVLDCASVADVISQERLFRGAEASAESGSRVNCSFGFATGPRSPANAHAFPVLREKPVFREFQVP